MEKDGAFKQRLHAHLNHPRSHGFNAFLKEQQALPDEAIMSFIQFDSQDPHEVVHHFKPFNDISAYDLDDRYSKSETAPKYLQESQSWPGAGSSSD